MPTRRSTGPASPLTTGRELWEAILLVLAWIVVCLGSPALAYSASLNQEFEYSPPHGDPFLGIPSRIKVTVEVQGQKHTIKMIDILGVETTGGMGTLRYREQYYGSGGKVLYSPEIKVRRGIANVRTEESGGRFRITYDYASGVEPLGIAGSAKVFDKTTGKILATYKLDIDSLSKDDLELEEDLFDAVGKVRSRARLKISKIIGKVLDRKVVSGERKEEVYIFAWPTMTYGGLPFGGIPMGPR